MVLITITANYIPIKHVLLNLLVHEIGLSLNRQKIQNIYGTIFIISFESAKHAVSEYIVKNHSFF
jgi:hypothetical protein